MFFCGETTLNTLNISAEVEESNLFATITQVETFTFFEFLEYFSDFLNGLQFSVSLIC